jgi:hypothetical protein
MLNSSVFYVITRRTLVLNRRFGTTYRSHLQGLSCPSSFSAVLSLEDRTHRWSRNVSFNPPYAV